MYLGSAQMLVLLTKLLFVLSNILNIQIKSLTLRSQSISQVILY
ncbi:hypothetical protein DFP79_1405 [Marinomonas balearica]|uniref:Uncharacterized protein n=1 Tax=Marinomonas balearica TaxID=491947 RepID=A0A4R6MBK2_9GAMM|nr:hypothetical protein DFP79_1405 [Marinomonas balearica]